MADFEGETYGEWQVTGEAFGRGPARGALPGQMHVDGFNGKGLVNSFVNGDDSVGTLTSPEFTIERTFLRFLIGGGGWPEKAGVHLVVDGKRVFSAAGPNHKPGGSERLEADGWDVTALAGKTARIEIIDAAKGSWGHINADHFVLTDAKPPLTLIKSETRNPGDRTVAEFSSEEWRPETGSDGEC